MSERMEAAANAAEDQGGHAAARIREQIRAARADKTTPRVPVAIIDRVEFSDANPLKNGHIRIQVGEKKATFHFRRKTRDQARVLYEELVRQIDAR